MLTVCLTVSAGAVHAELPPTPATPATSAPRGAAALGRAHAAWNRGDFDTSETLFKEALDQGGLPRKDALDANVYLGAARAVVGKKEPALVAFRVAALLDPRFQVPPEAGKKAIALGNIARRQQAKIGALALKAEMPAKVPANQAFPMTVTLDPGHAAILARVGVSVTDGFTEKPYYHEEAASTQIQFHVPANAALSDAMLVVKFVGLDGRDNELVSAEGRVQVLPAPKKAAPPVVDLYAASSSKERDKGKKGGGFFSTAWPFLIGGVALAGAGAGVYFATRPGDQVSVTQVRVQAIQ